MRNFIKLLFENLFSGFLILLWALRKCLYREESWTYQLREGPISVPIRIIANGTSLNEEIKSMGKVQEANYCMLNDSVLTPLFDKFKPKEYIIADPLYFSRGFLTGSKGYLSKFRSIDWSISIYVPIRNYKYACELFGDNKQVTVKKLPSCLPARVKSIKLRNYFYKRGMACPPIQNVVVGAIYASIMNGYKRIELYGVDHNWTMQVAVNQNNEVCLRNIHYYDLNAPMEPWLQCNGQPYHMHMVLRDLAQMFDSYWELRHFVESLGDVKVVNKTKDSFIDAFERE